MRQGNLGWLTTLHTNGDKWEIASETKIADFYDWPYSAWDADFVESKVIEAYGNPAPLEQANQIVELRGLFRGGRLRVFRLSQDRLVVSHEWQNWFVEREATWIYQWRDARWQKMQLLCNSAAWDAQIVSNGDATTVSLNANGALWLFSTSLEDRSETKIAENLGRGTRVSLSARNSLVSLAFQGEDGNLYYSDGKLLEQFGTFAAGASIATAITKDYSVIAVADRETLRIFWKAANSDEWRIHATAAPDCRSLSCCETKSGVVVLLNGDRPAVVEIVFEWSLDCHPCRNSPTERARGRWTESRLLAGTAHAGTGRPRRGFTRRSPAAAAPGHLSSLPKHPDRMSENLLETRVSDVSCPVKVQASAASSPGP